MFDLGGALSFLRLPVRILAGVCVASAILVFAQGSTLDAIGLAPLVVQYRPYVGATFVVSTSILAVAAFSTVASFLLGPIKERVWLKRRQKRLHDLTEDEKRVLRGYIYEGSRSSVLSYGSGVVAALVAEKVISRASNLGTPGTMDGFAYVIQPWAWLYLNAHSDLLE